MKLAYANTLERLWKSASELFSSIPFRAGQSFETTFYTSDFPLLFDYDLGTPVKHLVVTYLRNTTDDAAPSAGVFIDWIPDGGQIRIRNITGLTSGKVYNMRFLAFA